MLKYFVWLMFSFEGRVGRLVFILGIVALYALLSVLSLDPGPEGSGEIAPTLFNLALQIVVTLAAMPLAVKRLHDIGWSGWWFVAMNAFSAFFLALTMFAYLAGVMAMLRGVLPSANVFFVIGAINLVVSLLLLFMAGTDRANDYGQAAGPPPEARGPASRTARSQDPLEAFHRRAASEVRGSQASYNGGEGFGRRGAGAR